MAQVAQDAQLQATIDDYLDYLIHTWKSVPLNAQEWDAWDDLSQLSFVVNWGVPADRLDQLRRWAEGDRLTAKQQVRYQELLTLVERYRPILEAMLEDETA